MERLIISAPFGNWLRWKYCTSTLGTFTREYRGGIAYRLWRMARTLRYYPGIQAWKNQLGLPNPGVAQALAYPKAGIISLYAVTNSKWLAMIMQAMSSHEAIELNVSCPNIHVGDYTDYPQLFRDIQVFKDTQPYFSDIPVIVKVPPINYEWIIDQAWDAGLRWFHCCNTLPIIGANGKPLGGLSGKPLIPLVMNCIKYITSKKSDVKIIAGGGVTHLDDAQRYIGLGASHVAVGSVLLNPLNWGRIKRLAHLLR